MPVYQAIDFAPPDFGELTAGPVATAGYRDAVMALGPTAYWTLDETSGPGFADLTGNHPLTISGSVTLGQPSANRSAPGAAARFIDGSANSAAPVLPTSASAGFTLLAWVKRETLNQTGGLFGQFDESDPGRLIVRLLPGGAVRYRVVADSAIDTPAGAIGTDWAHLTIVREANTVTLYINGQPVASRTNQLSPLAAAGFTLGAVVLAVDMQLDEVAVLPEALLPEQVAWLYRRAASLPTPDFGT